MTIVSHLAEVVRAASPLRYSGEDVLHEALDELERIAADAERYKDALEDAKGVLASMRWMLPPDGKAIIAEAVEDIHAALRTSA